MKYNSHAAKVGDRIELREPGLPPLALTVWQVTAPGGGGVALWAGPKVWAHTRPGGYGITFDAGSYHAPHVFHQEAAAK